MKCRIELVFLIQCGVVSLKVVLGNSGKGGKRGKRIGEQDAPATSKNPPL